MVKDPHSVKEFKNRTLSLNCLVCLRTERKLNFKVRTALRLRAIRKVPGLNRR